MGRKKRTKFDPFRNVGTADVFLSLVEKPRTPTEIASELGIKPPSVIEQLDRLLEVGVAKLHEKRGRLRFYGVDWANFSHLFLEELVCFELAPELEDVKKLEKNPYFLRLLNAFYRVQRDAREILREYSPTIHDTIFEFGKRLMSYPKFRKDLPSAPRKLPLWWDPDIGSKDEMREFLSLLEKLRKWLLKIEVPDPLFEGLTEHWRTD